MKAVVKISSGPGMPELRTDVPIPKPGAGEVLLKVEAAGICGTDLHIIAGEYKCNAPVILGHEFVGKIVELGKKVDGWKTGERVTSMAYAHTCGKCGYCQDGDLGLCASRQSYGTHVNGAFAEYIKVNASRIFSLPDSLESVPAALTEPLACVCKAVFEVAQFQPGERALVIGPGAIGLLTVQVLHAAGGQVGLIGLKQDESRMLMGEQFGANHIFYAQNENFEDVISRTMGNEGGADVVFECSGSRPAFSQSLNLARKKGRVIQVGLFGKSIDAEMDRIVMKDISVKGSFASSINSWKKALELEAAGSVNLAPLVSDVYRLKDWEKAFLSANNRSRLKVVFQP